MARKPKRSRKQCKPTVPTGITEPPLMPTGLAWGYLEIGRVTGCVACVLHNA